MYHQTLSDRRTAIVDILIEGSTWDCTFVQSSSQQRVKPGIVHLALEKQMP